MPGGVDEFVGDVAVREPRVRVRREQRSDAVDRLAHRRVVAAREDAAVVTDDAVLTGAAGDPVEAPAADEVVVARVAEDHVGADAGVHGVVAGLGVDLVVATDVHGPAVAAGCHGQDRAAVAGRVRGRAAARAGA